MEASPLVQQERPDTFQPKIVQLYDELFLQSELDISLSDGFWKEFFLLRPNHAKLQRRLDQISPAELIHFQHESQQLFYHAVSELKRRKGPEDENALDVWADCPA